MALSTADPYISQHQAIAGKNLRAVSNRQIAHLRKPVKTDHQAIARALKRAARGLSNNQRA
jgi:hypothetical protein